MNDTQKERTHKHRNPRRGKLKTGRDLDKGSIEKFIVRTTKPSVAAKIIQTNGEHKDLGGDQYGNMFNCIKSKSGASPKGIEGQSLISTLMTIIC